MLWAERKQHGIVVGRRLKLEVEVQAELLAQAEAERSVDPGAQRGVNDELHPARLVEEPLEDDVVVGGQHAPKLRAPDPQVIDDQRGGDLVDSGYLLQEDEGGVSSAGIEPFCHGAAQPRDLLGKLVGAAGRLAQPERDRGVLAGRVAHAHHAVRHLHDLPRMAAQEEHVAVGRFDGEVLVDRADEHVAGLHQHPVVTALGDRSTRGESGQPRAAAAAQPPVDPVAVQIGHPLAASGLDAGRDQVDDLVELTARQPPEWPGAGDELEQPLLGHAILAPRGHLGHDLLGQDVQRLLGRVQGIEAPAPGRGQQRDALDQVVARGRIHDPARHTGAVVVGPPDALQERGDAVGRADLAHELNRSHVDAELQRCGGHQRTQLAGTEPMLNPLSALAGQRSVVGGHLVLAEPFPELMGHPL
jgi:hypothetical protein